MNSQHDHPTQPAQKEDLLTPYLKLTIIHKYRSLATSAIYLKAAFSDASFLCSCLSLSGSAQQGKEEVGVVPQFQMEGYKPQIITLRSYLQKMCIIVRSEERGFRKSLW